MTDSQTGQKVIEWMRFKGYLYKKNSAIYLKSQPRKLHFPSNFTNMRTDKVNYT